MSRPRKRENTNLPDNLYRKDDKRTDKTYYSYRDPRNGKTYGLGTDRQAAENDAKALNAAIYASIRSAKLAAMATPKIEPTTPKFSQVISRHMELCEKKRKLAKNTLRTKKCTSKAWEAALGSNTPIGQISVRNIVDVLDNYQDRPRMAQSMRSAAIDIWKDAMQEGWVTDNIPDKTRSNCVEVVRSRLTLDDFNLIHAAALKMKDKWVVRAMELALVTAQRREDIAAMEFRQSRESTSWIDSDALCVIQHKTKNRVRIPFNIGVNGLTISSVIKSCRDDIVSRWLVHHSKNTNLSKPGDQVWIDTITRRFAAARDMAGVKGEEGKNPPSFHEIRSLAIRLYSEAYGPEFAQAIAGHKDAAMTAVYRDVRGSEWVQVQVKNG